MSDILIKKYIDKINSFNEDIETKRCVRLIDDNIIKIDKRIQEIDEKYLIKPHFRKYVKKPYKVSEKAYATLLMVDESYLPSVLVLGYSLRKFKNNYNLVCLVQDKPTK